jgi:hypothetical protein
MPNFYFSTTNTAFNMLHILHNDHSSVSVNWKLRTACILELYKDYKNLSTKLRIQKSTL